MSSSCRVLIVEDEYFLAADLEDALRSEGAEIVGPICELSQALAQVEEDVSGRPRALSVAFRSTSSSCCNAGRTAGARGSRDHEGSRPGRRKPLDRRSAASAKENPCR